MHGIHYAVLHHTVQYNMMSQHSTSCYSATGWSSSPDRSHPLSARDAPRSRAFDARSGAAALWGRAPVTEVKLGTWTDGWMDREDPKGGLAKGGFTH